MICFEQTGFPHTSQNFVFVVFFFLCILPEMASFSNATWTRRVGLVSLFGSDDDDGEDVPPLLREARENHERLVFLAIAAVALFSLFVVVVVVDVVYGLLNKHGTQTSSINGTFHF